MLAGVISNLRGFIALTLTELSLLWVRLIAFVMLLGVPILCVLALWHTLRDIAR
jgi:hypothetical protein